MATYLAGILVGVSCGWLALHTTFAGTEEERARAVRFWGFRAPLGAWISTWGAIAMLSSAPFDDWWHRAYGLDVKIVSPPHALLSAGLVAIVIGALVMTLAEQNRLRDAVTRARLERGFVYAAGLMLALVALFTTEYSFRGQQHGSTFYRVSAIAFPALLVGVSRAGAARWPATWAAVVYMAGRVLAGWILPLFPAEPKLGPIYNPVDHFVALEFPLLLVAPALAIDTLLRSRRERASAARDWLLAPVLGAAFVAALLAAQWPFAEFLHSPAARNWVFFADNNAPYWAPPTSLFRTYRFSEPDPSRAALLGGLAWAFLWATLTARLGLAWGFWMRRVRR